jgi:hypothetical protein
MEIRSAGEWEGTAAGAFPNASSRGAPAPLTPSPSTCRLRAVPPTAVSFARLYRRSEVGDAKSSRSQPVLPLVRLPRRARERRRARLRKPRQKTGTRHEAGLPGDALDAQKSFCGSFRRSVVDSKFSTGVSDGSAEAHFVLNGETTDRRQLPQNFSGFRRAAETPAEFFRLPQSCRNSFWFFRGDNGPSETPAEFFWLAQNGGNSCKIFQTSAGPQKLPQNFSGFRRAAGLPAERNELAQSCGSSRRMFRAPADRRKLPQNRRKPTQREARL